MIILNCSLFFVMHDRIIDIQPKKIEVQINANKK